MKSGQPLLKRIIKIEIKKQNKNWRVTKESKIENKKEKFEFLYLKSYKTNDVIAY